MTNARFSRITDELLSAYLDDEVTAEERGWVEEAVAADATIAWRLSSLQQTVHLLRSLPAVAMPRSFVLSPEEATQEMVVQTPVPVAEPARMLSGQERAGGVWASFQRWWGSGSPLWRNAAAISLTLLLVLISAPRFLASGPMDAAAPAAVMAPAESVQEEIAPAASVADVTAAPEVAGAVDTSSAVDAGGGAEVAAATQPESAEDDGLADSAAPEDASADAPSSDAASGNMVAAGEASVGAAETACPADGISCGVGSGGMGDAPAEMGLAMMPSGSGPTDPLGEAAAAGSAGDPALRTGATEALAFPAAPPMAAAPAAGAVVENAAAESVSAESAPAESVSAVTAVSEAVVAEIPVAAAEAAAPAAKQPAEATATALPTEQASALATASPLPAATAAPEVAVEPAAELVGEAAIVAEAEVAEVAKPVEPVALAGKETDQSSSETVATVVTAAPVGTLNWVAGGLWAAAAATLLFGALWWRSRRP